MTPFDCIQDIAVFLQERLKRYEGQDEERHRPILCYAGFLPKARDPKTLERMCPAVVVGYGSVYDREEETVVAIVISIVTHDTDLQKGAVSLFHIAEYIRQQLLTNNPICRKYMIKNGTMETSVPDEQPYPQWCGRIDFEVPIPQPQNQRIAALL